MSTTAIILIMMAVVVIVVLALVSNSGPRVTQIDRTIHKDNDRDSDA